MKAKHVLLRRLGLLKDDEVVSAVILSRYSALFDRPLAEDVIQAFADFYGWRLPNANGLLDLELRDIYLHGRHYTWSNEQACPTLVCNDRVLCTPAWETAQPHCLLRCLSSAASDHAPLLIDCVPRSGGTKRFHFERFWPKMDGFLDVVSLTWNVVEPDPDPLRHIYARLKATARRLHSWGALTLGDIATQLLLSRELIARLDEAKDKRRAWFSCLKDGETNSAFFRIHSAHRKQKNRITQLRVGDDYVLDEATMARVAYDHFSSIIGSHTERPFTLNFQEFDQRSFDLSDLEQPFTEEEIWHAVKLLLSGKAPGPDGFTIEFLRASWSVVKDDICEAFAKLYALNGRGFQKLNKALLTLLPKKPDASSLADYRPISLIHLLAKLFAKVLSLRLAPRLSELVSSNQSAFIAAGASTTTSS
ncbi:uncharacterized protein [Aegilops tauschii subsp. strangulata]|uniref:uncharacterized protein n=1 Tax=Aegilops tauschii subsp. strangulata TaxID=200361 RepID=UPI003CC84B44